MAKTYKNIPVKPETYTKIKFIAEMNGLGERGMGAQLDKWAERELPDCEHEKEPVTIEVFTESAVLFGGEHRKGMYCPTCKRVYQYIDSEAALPLKVRAGVKAV